VQYGLIVQHLLLALKCRFLEFEANSNAALAISGDFNLFIPLTYYEKNFPDRESNPNRLDERPVS
jgi:hypothetical protein